MAIIINDTFSFKSKRPNFDRDQYETLSAMKNVDDSQIDEGHLAYCIENRNTYKFSSQNAFDEITGKWRVFGEYIMPVRVIEALSSDYIIPATGFDNVEYNYFLTEPISQVFKVTGEDELKWIGGKEPIDLEPGDTIVVSVINNFAVWGIFK